MSRKVSAEQYEKTFSYKFNQWLNGEKDPYIDTIEMKSQDEINEDAATILEREESKKQVHKKAYDLEHNVEVKIFHKIYKVFCVVFCLFLTFMLLVGVSHLPEVGNPENPTNNEVAARYIESGLQETGALNIVTGMILTYRAFDTFGETNVLYIATICVMIMLMLDEKILEERENSNDRRFEPKNDVILQNVARILVPSIFIFGIYIILNGQLSPGGGFSGGATLGAAMILYVSAFGFKKTQRFFNEKIYSIAKVTALCMYGCIGLYFYCMGANGLENHIPLGIAGRILSGGIILPIDICVGIEVACTMYAFYALFRRGGL